MRCAVLDSIKPVIGQAPRLVDESYYDLQLRITTVARIGPQTNANPMLEVVAFDMPELISECAPYGEQTQRQCDSHPWCNRRSRRNLPIRKSSPAREDCKNGNP